MDDLTNNAIHVRFPLAAKLSLGISALLIITFSLVTIPVFVMLKGGSARRAVENTGRMNQYTFTAFQSLYTSMQADTVDFASGIDAGKTALFWRLNPHIAAIIVQYEQKPELLFVNPLSPANYETQAGEYSAWYNARLAALYRKSPGGAVLFGTEGAFNADSLLVLRYSTKTEWGEPYIFVFFSMEHFSNVFNADVYESNLVNDMGETLMRRTDAAAGAACGGAAPQGALFSTEAPLADNAGTVRTDIEQNVIYESVYTTTKRTFYTMLVVWALAMIV
ncbi:MAG: hypothetical protein LBC72_05420, partial [Spirochaetaceae bacterium]|nr:hypothetical protein [Spirochaetaceae bacterium]